MRRGQVDEWKEWLTPELARCFAGECADVAARFGYDLARHAADACRGRR
jgi:hypothetical protein